MSLAHVHMSCCHQQCFAVITLHPDEERRLRETKEWFYCPAGHQQHFTGKTEQQKRIEQLERELGAAHESQAFWRSRWEESQSVRTQLVHSIQVCPLGCGWHGRRRLAHRPTVADLDRFLDRVGRDLDEHLVREHNATRAPVALLTERAGA